MCGNAERGEPQACEQTCWMGLKKTEASRSGLMYSRAGDKHRANHRPTTWSIAVNRAKPVNSGEWRKDGKREAKVCERERRRGLTRFWKQP